MSKNMMDKEDEKYTKNIQSLHLIKQSQIEEYHNEGIRIDEMR